MSLFNEALEETRQSRAALRIRNLVLAVVGLFVLFATAYVFSDIDRQLDRASSVDSDNVTWSVAQVEVDTLKLQRAIIRAIAHPEDPDRLDSVRLLFDIFYSRFNIMARSDQMDSLPINQGLRADLWAEGGFFDRITPLMDGPDPALAAALPSLESELAYIANDVRHHVVSSLQDLIATGDLRRHELRASLQVFAAAALGLTGMLGGFAIVIVLQNRAQQRRTEATERAVHNLRTTIENSLDAVLIADRYGIITDCNRAAEDLFGLARDDTRGRFLADLIGQADGSSGEFTQQSFRDPANGAKLREGRLHLSGRHRDGHLFPAEVALTEAKGANGDPMTIAFVRDISERIEREETMRRARNDALKGEEAKSRFLAVMSHEMRTPLNGLIAAAELMQNSTTLDQRQAWLSEIVLSCGLAALDQVNNVLELTRLGSDKTGTYPASAFSPVQVIRELLLQNQPHASKRGNLLHFAEPAGDVPWVMAPRQLFLRVLYNLVGNAIKFTDGGAVTVSLATERQGDGLHLVVSVIDTGIGIAETDLERIFHNFETLDASYARMREGSGLGLGIAKLSAEAMGGEIRVQSELGKGSTFIFDVTLPLSAGQAETAPRSLPPERAGSGALSILVVEDNPINSMLLTEMLRLRGHEVASAVDGMEAVAAAATTVYDLILMDISMPRMDGLEATRRIRAEGACMHVPIIGVTANASPERLPEFLGAGMSDVLVKPITRGSLMNIIEEHVVTGQTRQDTPPKATPSLVNTDVFNDTLQDIGRDAVVGLLGRVLQESGAVTDRLRLLSAEGKLPEAAAAAHKTAGAAAAIGLSGLYNALAAFERAALAGDAAACESCIGTLAAVIPETATALRDFGLSRAEPLPC